MGCNPGARLDHPNQGRQVHCNMPRKKQRRAWGSVTEVKRGKKYVLRWPDHAKRCGRATETFYGTYREACERLAVIQASGAQSGRSMTFGHAHDKLWIPDI